MSQPREVEVVVGKPTASEVVTETREQKKARIAQVLDRGMTNARLTVNLPPDVYGEWCPNDPVEIERYRVMGFEIDTKYALHRATHGGGDLPIVGDVIFMVAPIEVKELMDEVRTDQYKRKHGDPKKDQRTNQLEGRPHGANELNTPGVKVIDESDTAIVSNAEIAAALKSQTGE